MTPVEAHSGRWTGAPASRSAAKRSPSKTRWNAWYAARALARPARPWSSVLPERLQALVDLGVHARDEEGRDGVAVQRPARLLPALDAADVGLHHALVLLDR